MGPVWLFCQTGFFALHESGYKDYDATVSFEINYAFVLSVQPEYKLDSKRFDFWAGAMLPIPSDDWMLRIGGMSTLFEGWKPKFIIGVITEEYVIDIFWDGHNSSFGISMAYIKPY